MPTHQAVDIKSFLGLQKITVVYVLVLLLFLTWGSTLYQIYQIQELATRNSTAAQALCVFRTDLVNRRDSTKQFLDLSPRQRVEKYGSLGKIPTSVLENNLLLENRTIESLDSLRCH